MWHNYLRLGENEIVNTPRVVALSETLGLPLGLNCSDCPAIADMQAPVYSDSGDLGDITTAPWYDPDDPASGDFIGFVGLSIRNTLSSTRQSPVVQRLGDGGVLGRERDNTRDIRITGLLVARDRLSRDYGMNWLSSALSRNACGQHGDTCGLADVEWLADCPPERGTETDEEYVETVAPYRRFLHDVATTSGPLLLEERENDCYMLYEVEFTITAQEPKVYGPTRFFEPTPALIDGASDVLKNLIKAPSAENVGAFSRRPARNFVRNPSFEESLSRWGPYDSVIEGDTPPSGTAISRKLYLPSPEEPRGDYYCRLEWPSYTVTQDTVTEYGASTQIDMSNVKEGLPLRMGAAIRDPSFVGYNVDFTIGIRLSALDNTGTSLLDSVEYSPSDAPDDMTDVVMPESLIVPTGTAYVIASVLFLSQTFAGDDVATTRIMFDNVWVSVG